MIPDDLDAYGLVTLAKRWTPKAMKSGDTATRMMDAVAMQLALALASMGAFELYAPIILNPRRCLDDDLFRVLELNGVTVRPGSLDYAVVRRLAMLAPELRAWRGSFRAHRTIVSALTGHPTVLQTWVQQRAVMDESSMDVTLLTSDDANVTLVFLLTQGPDADPLYSEAELQARLETMAMPVLDDVQYVDCFALTAWRNGVGGWTFSVPTDWPLAVPSEIEHEYESADFGEVSAVAEQFVTSPTTAPVPILTTYSWWVTVWFKTSGVVTGETWEVWVFADDEAPAGTGDGYLIKVPVGNLQDLTFSRVVGGVPTLFGTEPIVALDGDSGDYHRLDVVAQQTSTLACRIRAYVDHNPTAWYDDVAGVPGRPDGDRVHVGVRLADMTAGRLRVAGITANFREGT